LEGLVLGDVWEPSLVVALQHSKVLVAVTSPGYFKSEYCGKEWALFCTRLRAATPAGAKLPPLIKSVVWVEFPVDALPEPVRAAQLKSGDPQALQNTKGLRYLLKQIGKYRSAYAEYVDHLAGEIVAAADQHDVPSLKEVPRLADVTSAFLGGAFRPADGAPSAANTAPAPSGPPDVSFIYVAANPQWFGNARPPEPYLVRGAGEWRPFFPKDTRHVHPLLQHFASAAGLEFGSKEVAFGPDLIEQVERAWEERRIIVLVVDPWSLHWDGGLAQPIYGDLLRELDARLDYHWCVLVPWNESDPVFLAERDALTAAVAGAFDRHATLLPNPLFFRDGIRSPEELRLTLAEVLTRLKEEIKKRAEVKRPVPAGPSRPVVSGPAP
jgi:FxsC-like protein